MNTPSEQKTPRKLKKVPVKILEATHFLNKGEIWTRGEYKVVEVFKDKKIHFEALKKI